jgi:t-SNARE complex subunit (syntaxin)
MGINMKRFLVTIILILLAGCATTAQIQSQYRLAQGEKLKLQVTAPPAAAEEALQIFKERLTAQLLSNGLLAAPSDASARNLEVAVTNYTMRHGAARAMLGIMAGSDNMQSTVKIKDQTTGSVLSEFTVESTNSTAWGTSKGMIEDHADKIVETLKAGKR